MDNLSSNVHFDEEIVGELLHSFARKYDLSFSKVREVYLELMGVYSENYVGKPDLFEARGICLDGTLMILEGRENEIKN